MAQVMPRSGSVSSDEREHKSILAVNLGLAANILLSGLKVGIGIIGHSPALLADGVNSTSDVAYYIAVSIFMRLARKPADDEHPYGHTQLESISSLVVGAFVLTTAVAIFWDSINSVFDLLSGGSSYEGAAPLALWVAAFTIVLKLGLAYYTRKLGRETGNPAVSALASDHRNDIFSATGAAIGIFVGRQGIPWVDPLAGALVALIVLKTGIEIIRDSTDDLMDTVPGKELDDEIARIVEAVPGVRQAEEIKVHRFGLYLVIYVTVGIDGNLAVRDGDCIATRVEEALYEQMTLVRRVHVHYHPATEEGRRIRCCTND